TLFASYKKAYKSGSYSLGRLATSGGVVIDNSFDDEKVEGGEGGIKARLAGGQLATNLGVYYYKFKGLQFSVTQPASVVGALPLIRAPKWQINFGAAYKIPMGHGWRLTLSGDMHFASRQLLNIGRRPDFFQDSYFKFDAAALLSGPDDKWELALIGKNLNNKI